MLTFMIVTALLVHIDRGLQAVHNYLRVRSLRLPRIALGPACVWLVIGVRVTKDSFDVIDHLSGQIGGVVQFNPRDSQRIVGNKQRVG